MSDTKQTRFLCWDKKIFSNSKPKLGEELPNWSTENYKSEEQNVEVTVIGVDVANGFSLSPVLEGELLHDGFTEAWRVSRLDYEMRAEIERLRSVGNGDQRVSVKDALRTLLPVLLQLHEVGYSINELQRLVVGSLRISITPAELAETIFG